jgi:hypothetical protein
MRQYCSERGPEGTANGMWRWASQTWPFELFASFFFLLLVTLRGLSRFTPLPKNKAPKNINLFFTAANNPKGMRAASIQKRRFWSRPQVFLFLFSQALFPGP